MENTRGKAESAVAAESDRLAKLICKLRWIGMEDEAHRLQLAHHLARKSAITAFEPASTD